MTSANLNFTGRLRIERDRFEITLAERVPPKLEVPRIDLSGLELGEDWPIRLEGRARDWLHREELGTVATPRLGTVDLPPETFAGGRRPRWRLLVVDTDDEFRRIAAMAETIPIRAEEAAGQGRTSLLPVVTAELGALPWRLVADADGFVLEVNDRLPAAADLPGRTEVAAWLLPAVLREILLRLRLREDEVEEDVRRQWLDLAASLAGPEPDGDAEDDSDWFDWIEQVVQNFAARHELTGTLLRALGAGE